MQVMPIKTRIFQLGENLVDFILEHIKDTGERDIIVITSKIAALAENRVVPHRGENLEHQKEELIKAESDTAIRTPYTWLTLKDGLVMASAGIDESNAGGDYFILLPKDSFAVARSVREALMKRLGVKELGVIVTDSRVMPLRKGTLGVAYGYAGFKGLRDYVGTPDIFGRPFKLAKLNIPDGLASAAVLVMGEGDERQPLVHIKGFDADFTDTPVDPDELKIPLEDDLYGPLFKSIA